MFSCSSTQPSLPSSKCSLLVLLSVLYLPISTLFSLQIPGAPHIPLETFPTYQLNNILTAQAENDLHSQQIFVTTRKTNKIPPFHLFPFDLITPRFLKLTELRFPAQGIQPFRAVLIPKGFASLGSLSHLSAFLLQTPRAKNVRWRPGGLWGLIQKNQPVAIGVCCNPGEHPTVSFFKRFLGFGPIAT